MLKQYSIMMHTLWLVGCLCCYARAQADVPAQANIDDLAWLAGAWVHTAEESHIEEHWLTPKGGLMLGVNRTVRGSRASFEFLRIARTERGLVYFASPQGREATTFTLVSLADKRVEFANPEHDFPQRIAY
jgi:hypothetical protein